MHFHETVRADLLFVGLFFHVQLLPIQTVAPRFVRRGKKSNAETEAASVSEPLKARLSKGRNLVNGGGKNRPLTACASRAAGFFTVLEWIPDCCIHGLRGGTQYSIQKEEKRDWACPCNGAFLSSCLDAIPKREE